MWIDFLNLPKDYIGLAKRYGLEFKLGEILEARVLKADAERALLLLKGQRILADVKTQLQPGDAIKVRVTGEMNNQVVLKVMNEQTPFSSQAEQMLRQAGFPPNDETRTALAFLLKHGLPVTPGTMQAVLTDQSKTLDQLLTRLFLQPEPDKSQNPVSTTREPSLLPGASQNFVQNKEGLFTLLKNTLGPNTAKSSVPQQISSQTEPVGQQKTSVPNQTQTPQPESGAKSGHQTSQGQRATAQQLTQPSSAQPTSIPEQISSPAMKGTLLERDASLIKVTIDQQNAEVIQNMSGEKQSTPAVKTGTPDQPASLNHPLRSANPESVHPTAGAKMPLPQTLARLEQNGLVLNPARNLPELIRGLKLLVQNFGLSPGTGTALPSEEVKPDLASLLSTPLNETQTEAIRDLSDKMLAMRLHHKEPGILLHMEIPLIFQQQLRTGVLQIREESEHREFAEEDRPLSILFRLETEDLGQLRVMVLLRDQEVNCQFSAEREETRRLLREMVPNLKERFEALSYEVSHMGILPLPVEEATTVEPLPGQVDFRV